VVLIEPGMTRTGFEDNVHSSVANGARTQADSPYAELLASNAANTSGGYSNPLMATGPESVARVVLKALESEHPRSRYLLTPVAKAMVTARTLGGDRVWDTLVKQQFKI